MANRLHVPIDRRVDRPEWHVGERGGKSQPQSQDAKSGEYFLSSTGNTLNRSEGFWVSLGEKTRRQRDRTMTEKKEGNEDEQRQRGPEVHRSITRRASDSSLGHHSPVRYKA
uniref:Uncharacterized protein n=1 Tax=Coccidioides posadasii RMSCC 3488 TaxID=454284 RepID=A0A0J6IEX5_COCPO|nr:hypothetical protein CPAG_06630 [Coccidioides posadasii RMSCC 3488]